MVTRQVQVTSDDLGDLNEALVWVIKYHDREFEGCAAFTIQIEKNQRCPNHQQSETATEWIPFYTATLSGVFEYDDDADNDDGDEDFIDEDLNSSADLEKE